VKVKPVLWDTVLAMALRLRCQVRLLTTAEGGRATPLKSGWRGLASFGEVWTKQDAALWPDTGAPLPIGKDLVYGCELRLVDPDRETLAPGEEANVYLTFWSIDETRPAMQPGANCWLREGDRDVGVGIVLGGHS
jgi:hypothetical protein